MKSKTLDLIGINKNISSSLGIILIFLLSFIVAWYTIDTAQKIIDNAPHSKAFNINARLNDQQK